MGEPGFVSKFVKEIWEDFNSPTTSSFSASLPQLKNVAATYDQDLDLVRSGLNKLRKSVKAVVNSGNIHVSNAAFYAESLEKLGHPAFESVSDNEPDEVGNAFIKFAVVAKELSALMKNLMLNMNNMILFPLESFSKSESKESGLETRKVLDKSWKEYDQKIHKLEKEQMRLAESAGLCRTEVSGAAIAEDSERERKLLQLNLTEYLLRVHELESKRPADLLSQLMDFKQAQLVFFKEATKTMDYFTNFTESLKPKMAVMKTVREKERSDLVKLRDALKKSLEYSKETYGAPSAVRRSVLDLVERKEVGTERSGYLLKKSEGKIKKVWQKRRCAIQGGVMYISHSDETKQPVRINLLTCQAKVSSDDFTKKCFRLISSSNNRTYCFQAEDEREMLKWISVLNNAKEEQLQKAFSDSTGRQTNQNVKELTNKIIEQVKLLPGNSLCCDCMQSDPEWLSTNFGVLICLECCGVHRELGVHISRTQSIVIDDLGTSQLLLARHIGNTFFNDTLEGTLKFEDKLKLIHPDSSREQRNAFIRSKYVDMSFAIKTQLNMDDLREDLFEAVCYGDLSALLQCFAEGVDLMSYLSHDMTRKTALHKAIEDEDGTTLYMIDFILQNARGSDVNRCCAEGNTVLHACVSARQPDAMKLLLRSCPGQVSFTNQKGLTPLDLAKAGEDEKSMELLNHALDGQSSLFENINFDWEFLFDGNFMEYSDDDLDCVTERGQSLDWRTGSRSGTPYDSFSLSSASTRDRRKTVDNIMDRKVLESCPIGASKENRVSPRARRKTTDTVILPSDVMTAAAKKAADQNRRKTTENVFTAGSSTLTKQKSSSLKFKGKNTMLSLPGASLVGGLSEAVKSATLGRRHYSDSKSPTLPPARTSPVDMIPTSVPSVTLSPPPPLPEKKKPVPKHPGKVPPPPKHPGSQSAGAVLNSSNQQNGQTFFTFKTPRPPPPKPPTSKPPTTSVSVKPAPPPRKSSPPSSGEKIPSNNNSIEFQPIPQPRLKSLLGPTSLVNDITSNGDRGDAQRCKALYDCSADTKEALSFRKGEIIVILKHDVGGLWEGQIDGNPQRRGIFNNSLVTLLGQEV